MVTAAQVTKIIDPLRVEIDGKKIVQLVNISIPDFDLYDPNDRALAAQAFLTDFLLNKKVRLYQRRHDKKGLQNRMGYDLVHLQRADDNAWVQGTMLLNGYATIRPSAINVEMAAEMIDLEQKAQKAQTGLWKDSAYETYTSENAEKAIKSWAVIEGTIKASAIIRNTVYLNFGDNWKTDFTTGLESKVRREMAKHNIDPLSLTHTNVRVYGWVEDRNGPYISLLAPEWLHILTGNDKSEAPEHPKTPIDDAAQ